MSGPGRSWGLALALASRSGGLLGFSLRIDADPARLLSALLFIALCLRIIPLYLGWSRGWRVSALTRLTRRRVLSFFLVKARGDPIDLQRCEANR